MSGPAIGLERQPLVGNDAPFHRVTQVQAPIVLFHGDKDEEIYYQSSLRLKALLKPSDRLVLLPGAGHNGMTNNPAYQRELTTLLGGNNDTKKRSDNE